MVTRNVSPRPLVGPTLLHCQCKEHEGDNNYEGRDREAALGFAFDEAKDFEEKTVVIGRHGRPPLCSELASRLLAALSGSQLNEFLPQK